MTRPIVLVTGGSGGIGSALVPLLISETFDVLILDKQPPIQTDAHLTYMPCDLSDVDDVSRTVETLASDHTLRSIRALVHLAAVYPNKALTTYNIEDWNYVVNVNLRSIFWLIRCFLQYPEPQLDSVILVSSAAAKIGSRDPAYASSKAGLLGLAHHLSLSLQAYNVRVNCVLPGIIETSMSSRQSKQQRHEHVAKTLARRMGTPTDVAQIITFLLSPESAYIWGATIDVNGGLAF